MKRILPTTALLLISLMIPAQAQTLQTGLADLTISDPAGERPLEGFIWYPTDQRTGQTEHHANVVWTGIDAIKDAEPASGQHPLVVLSHGMYGNAMNQSWLAAELAQQGFVVAAINHPGTSTWLRNPDDSRQLWERPRDISRVIDHFVGTPNLSAQIDPDHIYMAGHSLGGFTAVALAGGRYDAAGFKGFCDVTPDELVCGIFDRWQVAQTPEDVRDMAADLSDPRIKKIAVFDLGGTQTFSKTSLGTITTPMLVIGAPRDISGLNLDIESRDLVKSLPKGSVQYLEPETLSHFDFLGECKPGATELLAEEEPGDEIVCMQGGADRKADHEMIVDEVVGFFTAM